MSEPEIEIVLPDPMGAVSFADEIRRVAAVSVRRAELDAGAL